MDLTELEKEYAYLKEEDEESYDELLYDHDAVNRGMNSILDKTRENPLFTTLYTLAAGRFLTEDMETGLCVLLSYDYFSDFINVYESTDLSESSECYLTLKQKLS
jgi:hypothetical protein